MANPIIPRSPIRVGNFSLGQCIALVGGAFAMAFAVYFVFSVL